MILQSFWSPSRENQSNVDGALTDHTGFWVLKKSYYQGKCSDRLQDSRGWTAGRCEGEWQIHTWCWAADLAPGGSAHSCIKYNRGSKGQVNTKFYISISPYYSIFHTWGSIMQISEFDSVRFGNILKCVWITLIKCAEQHLMQNEIKWNNWNIWVSFKTTVISILLLFQ